MKKFILLIACGIFTTLILPTHGEAKVIEKGSHVAFDYTLTVDGQILDTSKGKHPLEYTQGEGMIIPGLENALEGLEENATTKVTIAPENGYGAHNPKLVAEVPKEKLNDGIDPKVGMTLQLQSQDGSDTPCTITEVKKDTIVLDFNHPLAGKELNFDITVVSVK